MVGTFRIVLEQDEGFDVHATREFDLALDSKFAVGRASKNTSKGYLLPAKHNVYIDSPVVSREHAILTANTSSGSPQVYITDTKSMHGTFVNGSPLVPHTPKQLSNGDKLQFGVNVNRNDSYFVAFRYTFNAELSNPEPFSRGFTVPEAESEEEELDFVQSGRGSQLDPLILDDSDAESEHAEHSEHSEDNGDVTLAQLEEEEELVEIDNSSEDDAADSVADDMAESDVGSDPASVGSVAGHSPASPLVHETQYVEEAEEVEEVAATEQVQATPADQSRFSASLTAPVDEPRVERAPVDPFLAEFGYPAIPDIPFPPLEIMDRPLARGPFDSTIAPPLPPRPSQKRQRIWDEALQEEYHQDWLTGEPSTAPSNSSVGLNDYTYLAHDVPVNSSQQFISLTPSVPAADRIQTPPPTLAADVVSSTTPPPTRKTGVSITDIVDEQPPTPTSVNSRKRSADDAFEEEAQQIIEQKVLEPEAKEKAAAHPVSKVATPDEVILPTVEQVALRSERPIAQPRSILRKALRAATLMVPATAFGAAVSIAALTALPESFFTVA